MLVALRFKAEVEEYLPQLSLWQSIVKGMTSGPLTLTSESETVNELPFVVLSVILTMVLATSKE